MGLLVCSAYGLGRDGYTYSISKYNGMVASSGGQLANCVLINNGLLDSLEAEREGCRAKCLNQ